MFDSRAAMGRNRRTGIPLKRQAGANLNHIVAMNEAENKKAVQIISVNQGKRFQDLSGRKFGAWTPLKFHGRTKDQTAYWMCRCDCGKERPVTSSNLLRGLSKSCGRCGLGGKFINHTGSRFSRLLVIKRIGRNKCGNAIWECVCDCGKTVSVPGACLKRGNTQSCGCLQKERASVTARRLMTTHGLWHTPEARVWSTMKQRCNNPNSKKYPDYGGRGIKVCERWQRSFAAFYEDMGPRPTPKHQIGRKENNGNYEPSNCSWETVPEQVGNKRNNVILTIHGEEISVPYAATKYGIPGGVIRERIARYGWSHEMAVSAPYMKIKRRRREPFPQSALALACLQLPLL